MIEERFSLPRQDDGRSAAIRAGRDLRRALRLSGLFLAVLFVAFHPAHPAYSAVALDLFTVAGVDVDVTANSAAEARKQALAAGEVRAFQLLLKRLTLKQDRNRLPRLEPGEIAGYVRDFQVIDEKTSSVRYLAKLTFRFKAPEVRSLLRDFALEFAETHSKPVLLLPVFAAIGVVSLWDDPNPWRQAWKAGQVAGQAAGQAAGVVPLKLPFGDLTDIATIGVEQALSGDKQRLTAIAKRYGVADTIVALATMGSTRRGLPTVRVRIDRYNRGRQDQGFEMVFRGTPGEGVADLLGRAALAVGEGIEDMWKRDNILRFDQAMVLAVMLPIRGLGDWVEVKRRLATIAVIQKMDLVLISRDEVRINLHHIGEVEQLSLALAQADLDLVEERGGWILNFHDRAADRRGAGPPIGTQRGGA